MSLKQFSGGIFTAFAIAHAGSALAQPETLPSNITLTPNGISQCELSGGGPHTRGEMPTLFANQYWSRMSCGDWKGATKLLEAAPKATPERGIPSILDKQSELAKCFKASFPYPEKYHNLREEDYDRRIHGDNGPPQEIRHGFFIMQPQLFWDVQRAITAACDAKLGIKAP